MPTFGQSGAPAQDTINLDALLSTSLFNYNKTLVDQISSAHPLWEKIKGRMKGKPGGVAHKQNLLYALNEGTTYSDYDPITITPTDGVTQSTWEWRQYAGSVTISGKEEFQNAEQIDDLLEIKIQQLEMGSQEFFSKYTAQGNKQNLSSSTIETPFTNTDNGSQFIDPLPKLIMYDPTASVEVGGLNQNTHDWWRNRKLEVNATTARDFLFQLDNLYNTCSLGVGGKPDLIMCDQITAEVWRSAYYLAYNRTTDTQNDYPFPNFKFNETVVTWDEKIPDVYSGAVTAATYGSVYMINTKFITPYYINGRNFKNLPFVRPHNQDAKSSLVLWAGLLALSNRKKQGVAGKIPRTTFAS